MTQSSHTSKFVHVLTKDTPYLALMGELLGVYGEHFFLENWLCYNGTKLYYIDGLVQERRNSSAIAMELRLCCTNPSTLCLFLYLPFKTSLKIISHEDSFSETFFHLPQSLRTRLAFPACLHYPPFFHWYKISWTQIFEYNLHFWIQFFLFSLPFDFVGILFCFVLFVFSSE